MALDAAAITDAAIVEIVDKIKDEYGEENVDETEAERGLRPMIEGLVETLITALQNDAEVTVTDVTAGGDTAPGTIS